MKWLHSWTYYQFYSAVFGSCLSFAKPGSSVSPILHPLTLSKLFLDLQWKLKSVDRAEAISQPPTPFFLSDLWRSFHIFLSSHALKITFIIIFLFHAVCTGFESVCTACQGSSVRTLCEEAGTRVWCILGKWSSALRSHQPDRPSLYSKGFWFS